MPVPRWVSLSLSASVSQTQKGVQPQSWDAANFLTGRPEKLGLGSYKIGTRCSEWNRKQLRECGDWRREVEGRVLLACTERDRERERETYFYVV